MCVCVCFVALKILKKVQLSVHCMDIVDFADLVTS